jgi:diguanylate cyclase (GGDEF)-like protein
VIESARQTHRLLTCLCALLMLASAALCPGLAGAALRYGQDAGLPSAQVQSVAMDSRGFLWVGTQDGVVRFDSHRFLPIDIDAGLSPPDPQVRRMLAVPGAVYLATRSRLLRFDLATERLQTVRVEQGDLVGAYALELDASGWIYVGTESGELYRWRDADAGAVLQPLRLLDAEGQPWVEPLAINDLSAGRSTLWLATLDGVYALDPATLRLRFQTLDLPRVAGGRAHVSALHEDTRGALWIGFWNDGLARFEPDAGRTDWFHPSLGNSGALRATSVHSLLERGDRLYIGSNRGIVVYRSDCACLRGLNLPEWEAREGSGVIITSLAAESGDDGLWAGVWGSGLVRFSGFNEAIERQVPVEGRSDSLGHPMVYSLLVDRRKRLWVGTYGSGVHWVEPAQRVAGQHWPLQRLDFGERRVESKFIWNLRDLGEDVLIGSGYGLFRSQGSQLIEVDPALQSLRSSFDLGDGRMLIGSARGLFLDRSGGTEAPDRIELDGLGNRSIWSIQRWRDEIWLGTDRGLLRLDEQLQTRAVVAVGAGEDTVPGAVVWAQKPDAQGRLWLATSGGLVSVPADAAEPRFERQSPLLDAGIRSVSSIEFDAEGQLWMGSPRGLLRYLPQRAELDLIDSQDGLLSSQQNSGASANDGERLYFGGIGGFVAFRPSDVPPRSAALDPALVKWRLGQGEWQPRSPQIEMSHDHASLQVEFSAFHYARPERVRYAYRWLPAETEFTELGDARSAIFSRLPAGQHRLELRADLEGPLRAGAEAVVLQVNVAAAWHQTPWARLLMAGLVVLAWFGFSRLRLRQAHRYAQGLEHTVNERTRQLNVAKEALEQANARLRLQVAMDPLTGLANRRALFDAVEDQQRRPQRAGVLLIDLDHFKRVNDGFGHAVGDAVLVDFAGVLQREVRRECLCARYGGEEFLVLLGEATSTALAGLAERLVVDARARRVALEGLAPIRYTISIGVALAGPGEPVESVIQRADRALYEAKDNGRDRWVMAAEPAVDPGV